MERAALMVPGDRKGMSRRLPLVRVHTLVIGSGAAGLNAAVQLRRQEVEDVLILTEGLDKGTSINTGSDKQTYYKLAMCGDDTDSPQAMAETYFSGGSMHGDLALVEASLSARAFAGEPVECAVREIVNSVESLELAVAPEQLDMSATMIILRGLNSLPVRLRRRVAA